MRILVLSTTFFDGPMDGGQLRTWHLTRIGSKRHEIHFLGMHLPQCPPSAEGVGAAKTHFREVTVVERPNSLAFKVANGLSSLLGGRPYTIRNFGYADFANQIRRILREQRIDLVHAHHPHTAQYRPLFKDLPCVYDAQNIYAQLWRDFAAQNRNRPLARAFAWHQAARTQAFETRVLREFDASIVCSDVDRAQAQQLAPTAALFTIPNGVDCGYFAPAEHAEETPFSLVYTAALNAPANIDACVYFVEEILPLVLKRYPAARLDIVGRDPDPRVCALEGPHVSVHANVPDVRPYQAKAQVAVVPLRIGSGTRLKVIEGMAMGKAIVSTSRGAEGIDCEDGRHLLLADTPATFAEALGRLFDEPGLRADLGRNGRARALEKYDWDSFEPLLDTAYNEAVRRRAR